MPQSHLTAVSPPNDNLTAVLVSGPCLLVRALRGSYLGQKSREQALC